MPPTLPLFLGLPTALELDLDSTGKANSLIKPVSINSLSGTSSGILSSVSVDLDVLGNPLNAFVVEIPSLVLFQVLQKV